MAPRDTIDQLRTALAGRYDIERELGRGGMATVYLAHDRKHGRALAIKVLRPELGEALGSERFLREIQIAANLTHPHILPLHDSGEAGGLLYYIMPYVAGESLRTLLDREKQLPVDEALRITGQVLSALTHAHSRGIVHRDIKPENILLADGEAVVADFGIARAIGAAGEGRLTQAGTSLGTPGYMSPEQVVGDTDLDARSDVYAVGCMLYEMLVGEPPFTGPMEMVIELQIAGKHTPASERRATVTPELDAVMAQALQKTPADRFATAAQFADALQRAGAPVPTTPAPQRPRTSGRVFAAGFGVALLVILAGAGAMLLPFGGVPFEDRDWMVVAQFDNRTGDTVFDQALDAALTASIAQSKHVNVFPQARVQQTLARMERPDTAHLDQALATEVAIREGVKVVLVPAISNLDDTYTLTARIVDAASGVDLATATSRADGRAKVLEAVDKLARDVRRDLGETRFDLIQNGGWFARATTSSLDALKAFTEGSRAWSAGKLDRARELWTQALTYDSTFAWAHTSLGLAASWFNDRPTAERHFAAAEAHLDRLTERERLWLRSLIAGSRGRTRDAIDLLETYTRAYPDDRDAWYNLGSDYMREQRCDDAIPALQHALDIDSTMTNAFLQMATCYNNAHEPEQAVAMYRRAFAIDSGAMTNGFINHEYGSALVEAGNLPEAEATFRRAMAFTPNRAQQFGGRRSLALLRMFQGRYDTAAVLLHDAATMARAANAGLTEYRNLLYLAAALRTKGDTAGFRTQLAAAERVRADSLYVPPFLLMIQGKLYAQAGDVSAADAIAAALDRAAGPNPTSDDQASSELLHGEVALARGNTQRAIDQLELAATRAPRPYFTEALARAYARAGDVGRAIAEYEKVIEHVEFGGEGQEPWILAHVELGQLYEAQGEYAKAIAAYQRFVDLWRDADPDLARSVDDIRSHIETLRKAHDIG